MFFIKYYWLFCRKFRENLSRFLSNAAPPKPKKTLKNLFENPWTFGRSFSDLRLRCGLDLKKIATVLLSPKGPTAKTRVRLSIRRHFREWGMQNHGETCKS